MSKFSLLFSIIFESVIDVIEAMLIAMQSIPMIQFTDAYMRLNLLTDLENRVAEILQINWRYTQQFDCIF